MQRIKAIFSFISRSIQYFTANFKGILLAIFIIYLIMPSSDEIRPANVVRINLSGQIVDSQKVVEQIDAAARDKKIHGVLFVINSPGGSVAPSIEISLAIKRLASIKPVITYAQGSLASGSYYASIWSTKIFANPGSLIGSIGVIFQGYNLEKVMKKVGISSQVVKAGSFKETGTFNRSWTKEEKHELNRVINDMYEMFVADVSLARALDSNKKGIFADAHIFSAARAKSVGLIDEVASIHEAKLALKSFTKLNKLVWQTPTFAENFAEKLSSKIIGTIDAYYLQPILK